LSLRLRGSLGLGSLGRLRGCIDARGFIGRAARAASGSLGGRRRWGCGVDPLAHRRGRCLRRVGDRGFATRSEMGVELARRGIRSGYHKLGRGEIVLWALCVSIISVRMVYV
jgi:hypothetical protein